MKKILVLVLIVVIALVAGFGIYTVKYNQKINEVMETVDVEELVQCYVDYEFGEYYHADNIDEIGDDYGFAVYNPDRQYCGMYCVIDHSCLAHTYIKAYNI